MPALARILTHLTSALLALLVLISTAETFVWTFFEQSWAGASEIEGLMMVWFGLLAAVLGIREGLHLGVEVLTRRFPPRLRNLLDRLAALLVAVFGGLLSFHGLALARTVSNTLPATGWPAAVQYLPAAVSGALMVLFALERLTTTGHRT